MSGVIPSDQAVSAGGQVKRQRGHSPQRAGALNALPGIILVGVLAWGLLNLVWRSIHEYDAYTNTEGAISPVQFLTMIAGAHSDYYLGVVVRTLVISVIVTVAAVALALPVAYFIVRTPSSRLRLLVLGLSLVPFLMGDVVRAFGWILLLGTDGAFGWVTGWLFGDRQTLVGSPVGIIIGIVQTMTPICIFVLLPAVRRIDPDIERAAGTLGAKPATVWLRVILPLMRPGLVAAGIVAFALATTQYAIPDMLGGGRMPFAANAIQSVFFSQGNINLGSAFAVLMLIIVLVAVAAAGVLSKTRVRHADRAGDRQIAEGGE